MCLSMIDRARLITAVLAGKTAAHASRLLKLGGGSSAPGVVARWIAPAVLTQVVARLPQGVVLVAGTNGKTTTARMIADTLRDAGLRLIFNRTGANLVSGLTAEAIARSAVDGTPDADMALFEVDEAALPRAIAETRPRLVVLHNLFRDQLDRYGEVDTIARTWRAALDTLPAAAVVLLNADDPAIAQLAEGLVARTVFYGIDDTRQASNASAHIADSQFCRCGASYSYSARFYAHIGHYRCPACGRSRPQPQYRLVSVVLHGTAATQLTIAAGEVHTPLTLPLPGLYNAANALAAFAVARELGIAAGRVQQSLARFSAAFGRVERVNADGRPLLLILIKNPVGAGEAVRMLTSTNDLHMLIVINDRDADGTDVSWLWDADFEQLAGHVAHATVAGTRAEDMAVRLKYAGIAADQITVIAAIPAALDAALTTLPADTTLYVLPTYTAMLELRSELVRRGWARPFWED